jgi:polar amino acid transport system substrate-binding protein
LFQLPTIIKRSTLLILIYWEFSSIISASAQTTFTVGVQDFHDYSPYSTYQNNIYNGFNRELLDLFAEKYNYTFIYEARPLPRLYAEFVAGRLDFKYPDNSNWNQALKVGVDIQYSHSVVSYIDGILVLPENIGNINKKNYTLGVLSGYSPAKSLLKRAQQGQIVLKDIYNYHRLLQQVISKRIEGAYINIAVSQYQLTSLYNDKNKLLFDSSLPNVKGYRHLSSFKHPLVIKQFNQFLESHQKDIQRLKDKYKVEKGTEGY